MFLWEDTYVATRLGSAAFLSRPNGNTSKETPLGRPRGDGLSPPLPEVATIRPFFAAFPLRATPRSSDPSAACDAIAAASPTLSRILRDRSAALLRLRRKASSPASLYSVLSTHAPSPAPVASALLPSLLSNLLNAHPDPFHPLCLTLLPHSRGLHHPRFSIRPSP